MSREELFESILDDITADDNVQQSSSSVFGSSENVNKLPDPYESGYKFLLQVGAGSLVASNEEEKNASLDHLKECFLDVLDACRFVKKYSDITTTQNDTGYVWTVFSFEPNFKKPAHVLRLMDILYMTAQKCGIGTWLAGITQPTWIRYVEFDKEQSMYNPGYVETFKETQLLHRRLHRERNSYVSDDAFAQIHSMVCTMMGGRPLTFAEFCNLKMTLDGTYDVPKTVLYMINRTTLPIQSIILPLVAKNEISDGTVNFKNLVLKWTKFTSVFRIPALHDVKELPVGLLPCRGDCDDRALRDELCNSFENDDNLKILGQPYIFTHYATRGGGGLRLSVICRVYSGDTNYMKGFVVTVPITSEDSNAHHVTAWVLAGILREGISMNAKSQIERSK